MADYQLSVDLTDAAAPIYSTNIGSLLVRLIPTFSADHSEQFFSKIELRCNLNAIGPAQTSLVDALLAVDGHKPRHLMGGMIKLNKIQKPVISMQSVMSRHHQKRRHQMPDDSNSDKIADRSLCAPSSSVKGGGEKHKKRVFVSKHLSAQSASDSDRVDECNESKQPLLSTLPAPITPIYGSQQTVHSQTVTVEPAPTPPPSYEAATKWMATDRLHGLNGNGKGNDLRNGNGNDIGNGISIGIGNEIESKEPEHSRFDSVAELEHKEQIDIDPQSPLSALSKKKRI